jgi:hypothetical protein
MKRVRLHANPVFRGRGRFGGLTQTTPVNIKKPAVIRTTDSTILNAPEREVRASMRTFAVNKTNPVFVIAEKYEVFAQNADRLGGGSGWQ